MSTACLVVASPQHVYPDHPEGPERFARLGGWEAKNYAPSLSWLEPHPARREEIAAIHSPRMLHSLEAACQRRSGIIDPAPTYITSSSFEDALNAAGGTLACLRAILERSVRSAFAIVRPPGHHAEPDRPMGFCLFNNLAIAVAEARSKGVHKALVFDFDAHHGNGTQAAFWQDEGVAYFSTHQENIYPGSGWMEEAPHARGRIVNLPLPARAGDAAFERIAGEILAPLVRRFGPQMIFVSAGFDAHWNDPLTSLGLSSAGFHNLAVKLVALAEEHCRGRILFVLEGGYNAEALAAGVDAVLSAATGAEFDPHAANNGRGDASPYREPDIGDRIEALLRWHALR